MHRRTGPVRRFKNFSRKRPVTAQLSLAPTAPNTVRRRITEARARERARNSYIRDHVHPPGRVHMAGYELITKHCARLSARRDRRTRRASATGGRGRDGPGYADGETGGALAEGFLRPRQPLALAVEDPDLHP